MTKNYQTSMDVSNLQGIFKILGITTAIWIGLANFAFVPHWINEMVGATPLKTMMSDEIIFASIFIFAVTLAFLFFNRLFALVFDLLQEVVS